MARVPVLGEVPAGDLRTAIQSPEGWLFAVRAGRFAARDLLALKVDVDRTRRR